MADFQEDGDRKLQIFACLRVGVTTLSITIALYLWYCFIYRNKNFACQWHFKGLSEAIKCVLTPLGVKVVFRPLRTLRQTLVRPKDRVPIEERKGVVYSIPCVECSSVYIGQTGRRLKQRISEHRRALKNGDVQMSALAEHVFKTGHAVDLSQSEVLDHHQHTTTRCMLESWYIQHNQAVLNRERGTLPEVYAWTLLD